MLGTFHAFFPDCHIEKSWLHINQTVLGVKERSRSTIIFKNIGENEMAELGLNRANHNYGVHGLRTLREEIASTA